MDTSFVVLGLLVGTLVGMTGLGAGSLVTPALALSGVPPAIAVGTDLAYAAVSKSLGALVHGVRRTRYEVRVAPNRVTLAVAAGAVLGVLVAVSSIGAGALGAVLLVALHPSMPAAARVAGADIAHAVPLTLVASLGHLWLGTIDFALVSNLLFGSIPGIVLGSLLAGRLLDALVRRLLALVLLYAGGRLAFASA